MLDTFASKKINSVKPVRSPFFYVGDKYKLMPQLKSLFPNNIDNYYDVFCGGGSASINVKANHYFLNDIDEKILGLHRWVQSNSQDIGSFIENMHKLIDNYGLSLSEKGTNHKIEELKGEYKKTYFSKYNKKAYLRLRNDYNADQSRTDLLYLLLIYGFNHMIRFNKQGKFNLPVGNVDWNRNVTESLNNYAGWYNSSEVTMSTGKDFEQFVKGQQITVSDFLYFDPPYLITFSDYNKLWNKKQESRLYRLLDALDSRGIRWGLSNMARHKGRNNDLLLQWSKKYKIFDINSNYISRFDNTVKKDSKEVYVTNG
ncbi:Dam family site-specific DNA-(adenine-N6)-methyltransferase [Pediococcus ethanolidurans]|uniref:Dam family site-specific DNA-(adenine-N6)-methyltransferase n=1 Tax=Pediococcus ethanolidurans TaxID=319653 RepID=UPI0021E97DBE|nr:Dam family site-specific DNA-(adenine-N6)-methyltransferase [Pediococcus ethanolidurans]MCV3327745.1 Dam family site-specific DNA-(adenine-N6)-methyltransferase [Pediococcus ethanolidurans]